MRNKVIATTSAMALALGMVVAPATFHAAMAQDKPAGETPAQATPSEDKAAPSASGGMSGSAETDTKARTDTTTTDTKPDVDKDAATTGSGMGTGVTTSGSAGADADAKAGTGVDAQVTTGTGADDSKQPSGTVLSEDLTGTDVEGPDGDTVAKIDQIIVDQSGKATHAVLRIGGLLGLGGKKVMVPWDELQVSGDAEPTVRIMASDEELEAMPEFKTQAEAVKDQERATAPAGGTATPPPAAGR